mmetsp:Transcript_76910/g.223328  ORF Transcript_76910/g.223328 Transcript_76910/m.223328 type:complete len:215 (-) Transcript_76910:325-969(-)
MSNILPPTEDGLPEIFVVAACGRALPLPSAPHGTAPRSLHPSASPRDGTRPSAKSDEDCDADGRQEVTKGLHRRSWLNRGIPEPRLPDRIGGAQGWPDRRSENPAAPLRAGALALALSPLRCMPPTARTSAAIRTPTSSSLAWAVSILTLRKALPPRPLCVNCSSPSKPPTTSALSNDTCPSTCSREASWHRSVNLRASPSEKPPSSAARFPKM